MHRFSALRKVALAGLATFAAIASAQTASNPLAPPAGNIEFLKAHATGTQDYICQPASDGSGNSWVFFGPQATLTVSDFFDRDQQVITHFLRPLPHAPESTPSGCTASAVTGETDCVNWQSSQDSSAIFGQKVASVNAGTDSICPSNGAIPCLLLSAAANVDASTGGKGLLGQATFVQRINTVGGSAPQASCQVGEQALVPYSADYVFFQKKPKGFGIF